MRRNFTYLIFMLMPLGLIAQNRTLTGKVTSSDDGLSLPGVSIVVQGSANGAVTDAEGSYSIELAPGENTLIFSFVGFVSQTVSVDQRSTIDVVLEIDTQTLEEVVVIGYGTVRKSDLTGSVSSIRGG